MKSPKTQAFGGNRRCRRPPLILASPQIIDYPGQLAMAGIRFICVFIGLSGTNA